MRLTAKGVVCSAAGFALALPSRWRYCTRFYADCFIDVYLDSNSPANPAGKDSHNEKRRLREVAVNRKHPMELSYVAYLP